MVLQRKKSPLARTQPHDENGVALIFSKLICAIVNIRRAFAAMRIAHIDHVYIALHKSKKSDYI